MSRFIAHKLRTSGIFSRFAGMSRGCVIDHASGQEYFICVSVFLGRRKSGRQRIVDFPTSPTNIFGKNSKILSFCLILLETFECL